MSALGPRLCKNATFMVGQPPAVGPHGPVSCADRFYQSANAQNAHHPLHVVGQDVQRHFGTDVLERLHLEVRRSHPRIYRAEGVLDSLAAYAHLIWIPIEPGLHDLKDGIVLPTREPALFACCALTLQCASLTAGGQY